MTKWYGWAGTILDVDLTSGKVKKIPLTMETAKNYIGGSGLAARMLYNEPDHGGDPFSPKNVIMITGGPLSGTTAPSSGRYTIVTRSPQTGIYLRTNGGGFFAPEMKWAGYDHLVIRGKAKSPVYLWILDDRVEIRDASHLWGKDTWETQRIIREELDDQEIQSLKIGPAGENLCISSCVIGNLSRAAGKGSPGAAFGSKNLKAIAVRGTKGVGVAKPDEFMQACIDLQERMKQDPLYDYHTRYGTVKWVLDPIAKAAWVPGLSFEGLYSDEFYKKYYDKNVSCFSCPLHCSHWYSDKEGKYKGAEGEGLEANAAIYGCMVMGVTNAAFACKYNTVCNQLGLHTDNPGCGIAWAMQLYKDGIITKEDTGGIDLTPGNEEAILEMVHKIAYREGIGDILDAYPLKAAEKLGKGSLPYVDHVKGMTGRGAGVENAAEWALALAVSTRGRDHLVGAASHAYVKTVDGMLEPSAQFGEKHYGDRRITVEAWYVSPKKAEYVYDFEQIYALCDMTGVCKFASEMALFTEGWHMEEFANLLSLATGVDFTVEDINKAAERELLLERAYNARLGLRRIDDYPVVFYWQLKYGEPHPRYGGKELPLTKEQFDFLLDEYYKLRGIDPKTGVPTKKRLVQVGLKDVADDLAKRGIISSAK